MPPHGSHLPGRPHGPPNHAVGLFVVDELFGFGAPSHFAAQTQADVGTVDDGVSTMGNLGTGASLLPRLDAVEEVPDVPTHELPAHLGY